MLVEVLNILKGQPIEYFLSWDNHMDIVGNYIYTQASTQQDGRREI